MALIRRKGSPFWWYAFTYAGKRYRQSTGQRTKAVAATIEAAALLELEKGMPAPSARSAKSPTLREFTARFLNWSDDSHALTPATKRFYRYGIRLLLFTRLADMPLDRITAEIVECTKYVRPVYNRKEKKATDEMVTCSDTYVNQALRTLKAITGKAVEWDVLRKRPKISTLKTKGRNRLIDGDIENRLQQAMDSETIHGRHNRMRKQAWLVLVILQDSGMRPDEVFPMRVENIHWAGNRIWVPEGKTENSRRFVGMSERMRSLLLDWCKGRSEGWVFPSKRSKSGHLESIAKGFQAARERAGVDSEIVPYSARHTYGTFQMESTGNVFAVSRAMGHADIKSMQPYQHPNTTQLNSAINERNRGREERRTNLPAQDWHTNWHTPHLTQYETRMNAGDGDHGAFDS